MKSSFQDQWPHCADHSECPYQLLLLQKKCTKNRILCFECLYSEEKAKCSEEIIETIPLSIALRSPGTIIDQLKNDSSSKILKGLFKICELDLEKQFNEQILKFELLSQILIQMKEQITQKLKVYKEIQEELKKQKESFFEKCNCILLRQLIDQLKEMDKQSKSDQYIQIILKINSTIEEMIKDNCTLITKNANEILQIHKQMKMNLIKPNNDQLISQINQIFQGYSKFIEDLNEDINQRQLLFQIPQFKVLKNEYFNTIIDKIEQGSKTQIKNLNLIYLGTRDGLNANAFWSKVNGKRNLLIIMKSQINQVFGGYSPCVWEGSGLYKQDDTLTSFLFSQTKNQIIHQIRIINMPYFVNQIMDQVLVEDMICTQIMISILDIQNQDIHTYWMNNLLAKTKLIYLVNNQKKLSNVKFMKLYFKIDIYNQLMTLCQPYYTFIDFSTYNLIQLYLFIVVLCLCIKISFKFNCFSIHSKKFQNGLHNFIFTANAERDSIIINQLQIIFNIYDLQL